MTGRIYLHGAEGASGRKRVHSVQCSPAYVYTYSTRKCTISFIVALQRTYLEY